MLYLTLRHYEYVCAIAQHGSLSAAAATAHVSQPALSTALARIEAQLGETLFLRRRGAAVVLTPQGRRFADEAQALLDQAARLERHGVDHVARQRLTLGCFSDLAPFLLAPALQNLRRALPDIAIQYRVDHFEPLIADMTAGNIDIALSYDLGVDASFARREVARRSPVALMPVTHPLAGRDQLALSDLSDQSLILSEEGLSVRHMLGLFKAIGALPRVAHRAASVELLRSLAANGEGVGITYSAPPVAMSYDGKPLAAIPISDIGAKEPLVLISHSAPAMDTVHKNAQDAIAEAITALI
ncbi:LysR family transcriptional regulator [Phaeobacter porticola]|uniref:Transcriptional regulator, LysR family n=1 Tax=Phaeobacter porticola TaxID=1844006 RepID=A0A1L3I8C1_9RHOB|nr:LysR family transcriptional regulator [Phaeobacter porticola]APG48262.1 transcriptional regulator, LysR family [Phaeobacter porticola]